MKHHFLRNGTWVETPRDIPTEMSPVDRCILGRPKAVWTASPIGRIYLRNAIKVNPRTQEVDAPRSRQGMPMNAPSTNAQHRSEAGFCTLCGLTWPCYSVRPAADRAAALLPPLERIRALVGEQRTS